MGRDFCVIKLPTEMRKMGVYGIEFIKRGAIGLRAFMETVLSMTSGKKVAMCVVQVVNGMR